MKKISFVAINLIFASISIATENGKQTSNELIGKYSCSFTQQDYSYPPYTCAIRKKDKYMELIKLSGSQRIKGKITIVPDGFNFEGIYFCPWGDCTSTVTGHFEKTGTDRYRGVIESPNNPQDKTIVNLVKSK